MPRRKCLLCGSKKWHKEPSTGFIACSEGHVLQNYRNEAADDELGPHALRKRTMKSGREKKETTSTVDPRLYHGARGRFHYFQCLQLILRKQIAELRRLWELPAEFEIICRDIWALHLSLLPNPPSPEPYFYLKDGRRGERCEVMVQKAAFGDQPDAPAKTPPEAIHQERDATLLLSGSSDEDEDRNGEVDQDKGDLEMAELLRQASDSSGSESSLEESTSKLAPTKPRKRARYGKYEVPSNCVAVLVVACWTLRIPVIYQDLIRLIKMYDLPYLEAIRLLPSTMLVHLTKYTKQALSPQVSVLTCKLSLYFSPYSLTTLYSWLQHAPTSLALHTLASRLARHLYSSYGLFTPEVNGAPLLWRAVRTMGGTPTLYSLAKALGSALMLPLTLDTTLAPPLKSDRKRDPESHKYDNVPPEVAFLATIIIVLKMVYGLDGRHREPMDLNDPMFSLPSLQNYLSYLRELNELDVMTKPALFDTSTSMPVSNLSEEMMDEYLQFCERALLRPDREDAENHLLSNYFPAPSRSGAREVEEAIVYPNPPASVLAEGSRTNSLRPGQSFVIYHSSDTLGSVTPEFDIVLARAASWAGVSEEYLIGVLETYERRLVEWVKKGRRHVRWDDGENGEDGEDGED